MMFSELEKSLAEHVIAKLIEQGKSIITVESCTGGLVVAALTSISGSSAAVYGGFVTYANEAKNQMADVPMSLIENYGAVSEQVARAMAEGALANNASDIAISVTGIAGPTGGTDEKPVGLVHFACATNQGTDHLEMFFDKNMPRNEIRKASVKVAFELVIKTIDKH